jgi:hypothetical protein
MDTKYKAVHNHPSYCLSCRRFRVLINYPPTRNAHYLSVCVEHIKPYWYGYLAQLKKCESCLKKFFLPWETLCSKCFALEMPKETYFSLSKIRTFLQTGEGIEFTRAFDSWNYRKYGLIINDPSVGASTGLSDGVVSRVGLPISSLPPVHTG